MSHSRRFLAFVSTFLVTVAVAAGAFPTTASAKAPLQRGQAPGWYRIFVGDFEVTVLGDGTVALPLEKLLTNTTPAKMEAAFAKAYQKAPYETSVNAFLINTGAKLVLVDAGAGALFGPTLGKLVSNLKASGYQPEQIDEVYLTHMHSDHVGSLVAGGKPVFPNAIIRAAKPEGEQWLSQANLDKAPDAAKDGFKNAMAALNPYLSAGKYKPFEGKTELVPGITGVPAVGHTDGHSIYVVESKGEKLVLWGDLMHVAALQFPDPSVTIQFDTNSKKAAPERKKAFAEAAKAGYLVGAAHLPFPGLGRLRADGKGYRFLPVIYTANNP